LIRQFTSLSIHSPLPTLERLLAPFLAGQELRARSPLRGAWINPAWGLPDPSHVGTTALLTGCAWLALWGPAASRAEAWHRALLAARYLRRAQRRSGLIDFPSCNWDSAPDTAFAVQLLCAVLERTTVASEAGELRTELHAFIRRAVPGLASGGFHTPNHRWVIASALAWAEALAGDARGASTVEAYRAEGIDQDADGAFQERSPCVYDAVTQRSLLLLARHAGWREARAAAHRNLQLARTLLHPDGTIESTSSLRQDRDWRLVPAGLAAPALLLGDPKLASWLWHHATEPGLSDALWLLHALTENGPPAALPRVARDPSLWRGTRRLPALGIARSRAGACSSTLFTGKPDLLRAVAGDVELRALSIALPYFGCGQLLGQKISLRNGTLTLSLGGTEPPRRPGYDLPLGQPAPIETWAATAARRDFRKMPSAEGILRVRSTPRGLACDFVSKGPLPGVPLQLAHDFPPGVELRLGKGPWRKPSAGEVLFLGAGQSACLRRGKTTWRLGPGASAHRISAMRDALPAGQNIRLIIALATPARHRWTLSTR
jgi:hypothetical protein